MTPTEIIATRLLGWERIAAVDGLNPALTWYESPYEMFRAGLDQNGVEKTIDTQWPKFTDERLKWYWVRRMEDALAERGLLEQYLDALEAIYREEEGPAAIAAPVEVRAALRATAEQRVAVAVKVLEGLG